MNDFETIVRNPKDYGDRLLYMKNAKKLCDAEIIVGTKRIAVHSIILASTCEYFENKFVRMESKDKELFLEDANPEIAQLLIDYCYTGNIKVSDGNVKEIMKMANMFIMTPIVEGCVKICKKILHPSNCISIWKLARSEYLENLKNHAFECIKKNFEQVSQLTEFLDLNNSEILEILNANVTVTDETAVFDFVMKWISHDSASRKQHLDQLSNFIRFENLPKNILLSESRALCSYNSSNACYAKILNALKHKDEKDIDIAHKNLRDSYGTLVAVGSYNPADLKTMEIFDLRNEKWTKIDNFECNRRLFSAVLLENKLILIGGEIDKTAVDTVESYDLKTGIMENLPYLQYAREKLSSVEFKRKVYAIGGYNKICLAHLEMWSPSLKTWRNLAPMMTPRRGFEALVLDEEIFVLGGSDCTNYLSDTESYNPTTNKWRKRASMIEKRYAPGAAIFGNYLYAVGGIGTNNNALMSAERYDPKIDKWTMIHSLGTPRSWMGAGNIMEKFVIVGGATTEYRKLSTMEMYDEENDNWICMPSLNKGRSMFKTIEIPWRLASAVLLRETPE